MHIIKDECVLMMHRISKKHDINHGKWIGVGGKFEKGETPQECMRREVREETGLRIDDYRYCGIVTFVSDEDETEYMHLFTVTGFHDRNGFTVRGGKPCAVPDLSAGCMDADVQSGADTAGEPAQIELKQCEEGTLEWLPKEELTRIPHWAGDRIFLPLILNTVIPFFSMKLVYRSGELIHASLNEHHCLVTDRLVLRPWLPEDAAALFGWAKSPKIGPRAGWLPHMDVADSRIAIREVLTRPEIYAITLRDSAQPVGSVGLQNFRLVDGNGTVFTRFDERQSEDPLICTKPGISEEDAEAKKDAHEDAGAPNGGVRCAQDTGETQAEAVQSLRVEADLGYWLAEPYWHQGIMTEAAAAVLAHARRDLGMRRVWADYYQGNDASCRVMQRLGFRFHHIEENRYIPALNERRTAIVYLSDPDIDKMEG